MTRELMRTISVSLTSSMCTALFVVACTAGATDGDKGGGSGDDDGGDGGLADLISDVAEMSATIAAQQVAIVELEAFESSALCFIGHMTDDQHWRASSSDEGSWREIEGIDSTGQENWRQGPNGDGMKAYDDCF